MEKKEQGTVQALERGLKILELLMLAIRIYPKSELLPHRQDFALVKWM